MTALIPTLPNLASDAVARAKSMIGRAVYRLGTGDWDDHPDDPSDCFGFAFNRCYQVRRHRPGFNVGPWASVSDDLNCNSAIEDAHHEQELFLLVSCDMQAGADVPRPGDLLAYPTFRLAGHPKPWIGHIGIVIGVPAEWEWGLSSWRDLTIAQCVGPNDRRPAIIQSSGNGFEVHDRTWPKPIHRSQLLRVKQ